MPLHALLSPSWACSSHVAHSALSRWLVLSGVEARVLQGQDVLACRAMNLAGTLVAALLALAVAACSHGDDDTVDGSYSDIFGLEDGDMAEVFKAGRPTVDVRADVGNLSFDDRLITHNAVYDDCEGHTDELYVANDEDLEIAGFGFMDGTWQDGTMEEALAACYPSSQGASSSSTTTP